MGAAVMAFLSAANRAHQPNQSQAQAAPPLAPPLGVGPVPGSRSARRHYQQHLQQNKQIQQQQLRVAACAPGPSHTREDVVASPPVVQAVVQAAPSRCPCTVDEFLAPFRSKMKAFKKLKKRLAARSSSSTATNNMPPLAFHQVHGENIELCFDRRVARRTESFCKAVTFSNRPVLVGEKVYIRFLEISDSWSGVIRMGFTSYDPVTLAASGSGLPRYACPDLTNKPGSWAKALSERFAVQGAVLYFYVTPTGDVHFGVNGEDKGFFFGDVDTRGPLWAVVDVYGNSTAIELVDPRASLNNSRRSLNADWDTNSPASPERLTQGLASAMAAMRLQPTALPPPSEQRTRPGAGHTSSAALPAQPASRQHHGHHRHGQGRADDALPTPRFQPSGAAFGFLAFHRTRGRNVVLSADRTVATRPDTEFCHGYVFTQRPVILGERIVVQVLNTEPAYVGALAFGLTSCDPSTLSSSDLPEDADFLLDRSEYWVVSKDVASEPQRGDELTFSVTHSGEVTISRNGSAPVVFMHVDQTLQLWAFLDVYGSTQRVRLLGSLMDPSLRAGLGATNQSSVDPHTANNTNNGRLACCTPSPAPSSTPAIRPPVPPHAIAVSAPTVSTATAATVTVVTPHASPAHPPGASGPTTATAEVLQLAANGGTMLVVNLPPNPHTYLPGPSPAPTAHAHDPAEQGSSVYSENGHLEPSVQQWMGQHATTSTLTGSECSICYERPIDSVLYMCGHMCMCYECAVQQWRGKGGGHCPMCRAVIRDVIRTYKS